MWLEKYTVAERVTEDLCPRCGLPFSSGIKDPNFNGWWIDPHCTNEQCAYEIEGVEAAWQCRMAKTARTLQPISSEGDLEDIEFMEFPEKEIEIVFALIGSKYEWRWRRTADGWVAPW